MEKNFFYLLLLLKLIQIFKTENIHEFEEKNYILTKTEFFKSYKFFPKASPNLEHEIIIQIKTTKSHGNIKLCTGYFKNANEQNIYYDYSTNQFMNCQKNFSATITDYAEFNIGNSFYPTDSDNIKEFFYVTIYLNGLDGSDFAGTIMPLITNKIIKLNFEKTTNYLIFKNNYKTSNFSFFIPFLYIEKQNLNIQLATKNNENIFKLELSDEKKNILDIKNSIII